MPTRLPLFPLAAVLFPGTPLPLHIFEPRYRAMLTDVLAGDRRFGIVPVDADGEVPAPGAIGCVAHVEINEAQPDGTSAIVVSGESRFVLQDLRDEPRPYLVGLVDRFSDEPDTGPDAGRAHQLRELFVDYVIGMRRLSDVPTSELQLPEDAEALSFNVAAVVDLDVRVKRRLLAERSTARRVDVLLTLLPALTARVEQALQIHERARSNGKGNAHPDIVAG